VSDSGAEPGAAGESAPATDESDAFISYSHLDRAFAIRLREALRAAGKRPWLDETEISGGTRWNDALQRAIEHADAFVFLLSPQSAGSPECRRELDYALELNKRILPVRIAETPAEAQPPRLAEYQFIPSRTLFGTDFAGSTRRLITEIETDRDWVREHTEWSEKASEWGAHDRNRSYLLSGVELSSAEGWRSRAAGKRPGVSTLQSEFIDASRQHATSRLRRTRGAVSVALAVAIGLVVLALILRQQAVSESHTARSRELAAESLLQLGSDPQLALRLAIASADVKHTTDALNALRATIPENHLLRSLTANGQPLVDAQWSSDGKLVATASVDNYLRVYMTSSGRLLRRFSDPALQRYPGGAIFVDGDRELLGWGVGHVRVWSLATGKLLLSLSDPSFDAPLSDVVVNRQGTMIATASGPGAEAAVMLWNARTGKRLHVLRQEGARFSNSAVPQQVAFSPDGRLLAGGSEAGIATVWSTSTGGFVTQLNLGDAHRYPDVDTVAFSPDGSRLATEQSNFTGGPGRTVLWNVSDWSASARDIVAGVEPAWSPGGSFISTTLPGGDVYVWSLASLSKPWARAVGYQASASATPVFGPGSRGLPGSLVIPSQNGHATVWNPYTGDVVESLAGDSGAVAVAGFSPDASRILTWSTDGVARIWNNGVITGTPAPHTPAVAAEQHAAAAALDRDGSGLQTPTDLLTPVAAYSTDDSSSNNSLIVFSSRTGRRLAAVRIGRGSPSAAFDRAGNMMLVTRSDDQANSARVPAQLRRTDGGALVRMLPGHAFAGILSPDGKLAAIVSPVGAISIWDVTSGRRLSVFRGDQTSASNHQSGHVFVTFSPDGTLVLSSDSDGHSFVWKPSSGHVIASIRSQPVPATQMSVTESGAISADDRLVVLAHDWDDDATVYRVGASKPLLTLVGNPAGLDDVAFSPNSQLIATIDVGLEQQVNVYDIQSQQPLFTIPDTLGAAVGFSADSRSVITDQPFPYEIYPCSICGDFDQLLSAAREREIGHLTPQERFLYLH
jgi:WD40 repeat protein